MKLWLALSLALLMLVMGSALALIYSKHQSRKVFVELQRVYKQINELDTEWSRLQLEQGAWSTHADIEKIARKRLNMKSPSAKEIVYIQQ